MCEVCFLNVVSVHIVWVRVCVQVWVDVWVCVCVCTVVVVYVLLCVLCVHVPCVHCMHVLSVHIVHEQMQHHMKMLYLHAFIISDIFILLNKSVGLGLDGQDTLIATHEDWLATCN